jgi:transposase
MQNMSRRCRYRERARPRELERLNRELEMENAFLKKAATYFAGEHR